MVRDRLFLFAFLFISTLSIFLRFYNYSNRWALAIDQASFALLARYALEVHKLPLMGPFSSAGPFQTGGEWYWFIMAATALYPNAVITPWVILTVFYVFFVLIIILVGKELVNKQFGLLVGLLATVSTAQIAQSANLTNQSPLAIVALFAIWTMIRYVRTNKLIYLFLLSLFVGLASTIHLQGVALIIIVPITIIVTKQFLVKRIILSLAGLFLPWLPIFIADSHNHFFNTHNMFQYYLHDQYKISLDVLGRRWLTYAGIFWPKAWSHIVGGNIVIGYIIPALLIVFEIINAYKKRLSKEWYIIIFSFIIMLVMLRYARTPLYDSYLLIVHPFIFLLTGWVILNCYKINRIFGILLLIIVVAFSLNQDIKEIASATNNTAIQAEKDRRILIDYYPNTKFAVYDYKFKTPGISQPLTLYLDEKNKIDDNGRKIGISSTKIKLPVIYEEKGLYYFFDISSLNEDQLYRYGWELVNPSAIYRNVQEWYKYKK